MIINKSVFARFDQRLAMLQRSAHSNIVFSRLSNIGRLQVFHDQASNISFVRAWRNDFIDSVAFADPSLFISSNNVSYHKLAKSNDAALRNCDSASLNFVLGNSNLTIECDGNGMPLKVGFVEDSMVNWIASGFKLIGDTDASLDSVLSFVNGAVISMSRFDVAEILNSNFARRVPYQRDLYVGEVPARFKMVVNGCPKPVPFGTIGVSLNYGGTHVIESTLRITDTQLWCDYINRKGPPLSGARHAIAHESMRVLRDNGFLDLVNTIVLNRVSEKRFFENFFAGERLDDPNLSVIDLAMRRWNWLADEVGPKMKFVFKKSSNNYLKASLQKPVYVETYDGFDVSALYDSRDVQGEKKVKSLRREFIKGSSIADFNDGGIGHKFGYNNPDYSLFVFMSDASC
ncbi:MAG: hypothetical protein ABIE74_06670 [Pseudomonadota bacterium]